MLLIPPHSSRVPPRLLEPVIPRTLRRGIDAFGTEAVVCEGEATAFVTYLDFICLLTVVIWNTVPYKLITGMTGPRISIGFPFPGQGRDFRAFEKGLLVRSEPIVTETA
jgi:hypothetical protein